MSNKHPIKELVSSYSSACRKVSKILSSPVQFSFLLVAIMYITNIYSESFVDTEQIRNISIQKKMATLENLLDGKIGLYALNTANNQKITYRSEERFPIQSTFKLLAVAAILKNSMTDSRTLYDTMTYDKKDIVSWSPITKQYIDDGMTILDLSAATMMFSDNTAANLLMKKLGGPKAVTAFAHSIGDKTFIISNWEAKLNSNPREIEDSSTPAAMGKDLQKLTLGNILAPQQREQLLLWMKNNTTGNTRIRAGVADGWIVADKTGSGEYGIANDIGIIWPPKCDPIIVAIYSVQNKKDAIRRDDIIASATHVVLGEFAKANSCVKSELLKSLI